MQCEKTADVHSVLLSFVLLIQANTVLQVRVSLARFGGMYCTYCGPSRLYAIVKQESLVLMLAPTCDSTRPVRTYELFA
jgi:hypothetical protein